MDRTRSSSAKPFARVGLFRGVLAGIALATALGAGESPKKAAPRANSAAPASASASDEVAAVVNGETIMLSELVARLDEAGVPAERREEAAPDMLDTLIDNTLLVQYLRARKVPYDAKAVEAEIAQMRAEAAKQGKKFSDALALFGLTESKLRAQQVALVQWPVHLKQQVSEKALADYLAKHRDDFDGSQVRASHILVEVPAGAAPAARAAARAKIDKIRKDVTPANFARTAAKVSDCPSKAQGGDVGFFPRRGKMTEPFAAAAFALKPGAISGVVESEFGYHLILVTERKPGNPVKLDEVRAQVLAQVGEELKDAIIAQQRKLAKIEIAPGVPDAPPAPKAAEPKPVATKKPATTKR